MRDTYILYTYKYRRLETSPLISHKCHTKSLRKSHKNTSDCHRNNRFVKHTKFPTRFICYGKFLPHFKTKNQIFKFLPIPQAWGYLRVTAVQPPWISNHILNSHWLRANSHHGSTSLSMGGTITHTRVHTGNLLSDRGQNIETKFEENARRERYKFYLLIITASSYI